MKKINLWIIFFCIFFSNAANAHKEWIHQYLVQEAFFYLKNHYASQCGKNVSDLDGIKDAIFDANGNAFHGRGSDTYPWWEPCGIAVGAWREDYEDPLNGYGGVTTGFTPSVTHFWRADLGNDYKNAIGSESEVPNAWMKARDYLFGRKQIFILAKNGYQIGRYYTYNSLIDFYLTGNCTYQGYRDLNGNDVFDGGGSNNTGHYNAAKAKKLAYQLLGRVAHLLGDMSVPAHTHNHIHPCPLNYPDKYENTMGGIWPHKGLGSGCEDDPKKSFYDANYWNAGTAMQSGSLITNFLSLSDEEAIFYLFYTTNQLSDHFSSGVESTDHDGGSQYHLYGNNDLLNHSSGSGFPNYVLAAKYRELGTSPYAISEKEIADVTFNYAIRATASLFYWFAYKTGQISIPTFNIPNPLTTNQNINDGCKHYWGSDVLIENISSDHGCLNLYNSTELIMTDNSTITVQKDPNYSDRGELKINSMGVLRITSGSKLTLSENSYLEIGSYSTLIIEAGGTLILDKNVAMAIDGRIEIQDGGKLQLLDDAEFHIDNGHCGTLSYTATGGARNFITGTNTKLVLNGCGDWQTTTQATLEIGGDGLIPSGGVSMDLQHIRIEAKADAWNIPMIAQFNAINIHYVLMTTSSTSGTYKHSGLHLYGQAGVVINDLWVYNAVTGVTASNIFGPAGLELSYCRTYNCDVGVNVEGNFLKMETCTLNVNNTGVNAVGMTQASSIDNSTINGILASSNYGINYSGTNASVLYMDKNEIYGFNTGILQTYSPLAMKCNYIHHVHSGINLSMSALYSGYNTTYLNVGHTRFDDVLDADIGAFYGQGLFLDMGYNNFIGSTHLSGSLALSAIPNGLMLTSGLPYLAIDATSNYWGNSMGSTSPNNNLYVDWTTTSYLSMSYPVNVNTFPVLYYPVNDGCSPFDQSHVDIDNHWEIGAPLPPQQGKDPQVTTDNFSALPMRAALDSSIYDLADTLTNIPLEVKNICDVLLAAYPADSLNGIDSLILNQGYHTMMAALGKGVSTGAITLRDSLGAYSAAIVKVMQVQDYFLNHLPDTGAYYDLMLTYTIDKGQTHCMAGRRDSGISVFNGALAWAHEGDKSYLNYLKCINGQEQDAIDSIITPEQLQNQTTCILHDEAKITTHGHTSKNGITACNGDVVQLGDTKSSQSGYSYSWMKNGTLLSNTITATDTLHANSSSDTVLYTLITTNPVGINTSTILRVIVHQLPSVSAGISRTICEGTALTLGQTPSNRNLYKWVSKPDSSVSSLPNPTINPTVSRTYILTLTDSNGCSNTDSITVTVNPKPVAYTGDYQNICSQTSTFIGSDAISGHTYSWTSDPAGFTSTNAKPTVNPTDTETTYILTETNTTTGCTNSNSVTISLIPLPLSCVGDEHTICSGTSILIGCTSVSGDTYSWTSNPSGFTSSGAQASVSPTLSTEYFLTETDTSTGCANSNSVLITVNATPSACTGTSQDICSGTGLTLGCSSISGHSYSWSSSPSGFVNSTAQPSISPTTTTVYYLTETDVATGCNRSNSDTITVHTTPAANTGTDQPICTGSSVNIGSSAVYGHSYSWTSSPSGFTSSTSLPSVSPTVTTEYFLTETDTNTGCGHDSSVIITVNPLPYICAGANRTVCAGTNVIMGCEGVMGNTYSWTASPYAYVPSGFYVSIYPMVSTVYTETETDATTGCTNSNTDTITVIPIIEVHPISGTADICEGTHTTFLDDTPDGFWTSGDTTVAKVGSTTGIVTGIGAGSAYISYTVNNEGCNSASTFLVTVYPTPTACAGSDRAIALSTSTAIGCSSVGTDAYSWGSIPSGFSSTSSYPGVTPETSTTYYVTETNSYGCSSTDTIVVTIETFGSPLPPLGHDPNKHNSNSTSSDKQDSVVAKEGLFSLDIQPNPFTDKTTLEYTLSKRSRINIRIYDMMGRLMAKMEDAVMEAGTYSYAIDPDKYNLAQGSYQVKVLVNDNMTVRRMIRLK